MVLGPFAETKGPRRAGPKPRIPFLSVILDISNRGSSVFVVGSCLWSLHSHPRQRMAPPHGACGRGCAPVPNSSWGRGLSERSEFRSPNNRDWGKGTRRATPGRQWFWVLLPKQKDLAVRGRNPARIPPLGARGRNPANPKTLPPFLSSLYVFSNLLTIPAPPFPSFVRRGEGR